MLLSQEAFRTLKDKNSIRQNSIFNSPQTFFSPKTPEGCNTLTASATGNYGSCAKRKEGEMLSMEETLKLQNEGRWESEFVCLLL